MPDKDISKEDDMIWGKAIYPEFRVVLKMPEYKKLSLNGTLKYKWLRFKQKISRLIKGWLIKFDINC